MTRDLFQRVVVPVASEDDARSTAAALGPYVDNASGSVLAVHVVEKAGGAVDKASVEQREENAEEIFEVVRSELSAYGIEPETRILYGTDVADTIVEAGHDVDASAIVFTPRDGGRWLKLLTGDVALELISDSDLPVVVLPDETVAEPSGDADE